MTPQAIELKKGKATRDAFGETLVELGKEDQDIVVLDADLNNSTRTEYFKDSFPERFFNVGIAESNLVGIAGGLASSGKKPWIASFACFLLCNAYDQFRLSIAYPRLNVKCVGSHGGISIGQDGPSQMAIEDIALACALPGFVVMNPADEISARCLVRAAYEHEGPVYIRVGRPEVPIVYKGNTAFQIGRANELHAGNDVTIITNGLMVAAVLEAVHMLVDEGLSVRVLDMHTVKPLDEIGIEKAAQETGAIVVAEEHLASGGLGSAVAMVTARRHPVPINFINLGDTFAESGKPDDLFEKYGLTADRIVEAVKDVKDRK